MRYIPIALVTLLLTSTSLSQIQPQRPLAAPNLGPIMPPSNNAPPSTSNPSDAVILSDVLGRDRSINIFAGFTRDFASISNRLGDHAQNTTVLAPINSAITALPRKPWEDPEDYSALGADAYEGPEGEDRASRNMRRFVDAHVVPVSPWKEGEKVKTLAGGEVWWEEKDGVKMVSFGLDFVWNLR